VAALFLASTVFAPVATAKKAPAPVDVDIQSVTLRPDGGLTVAGTIQCVEGGSYFLDVAALQGEKPEKIFVKKNQKPWGLAATLVEGDCETAEVFFTAELLAIPFEKGKLWAAAGGFVCGGSPFTCHDVDSNIEQFKIG
jgi:hypothetical protein